MQPVIEQRQVYTFYVDPVDKPGADGRQLFSAICSEPDATGCYRGAIARSPYEAIERLLRRLRESEEALPPNQN